MSDLKVAYGRYSFYVCLGGFPILVSFVSYQGRYFLACWVDIFHIILNVFLPYTMKNFLWADKFYCFISFCRIFFLPWAVISCVWEEVH